MNCHRRLAMLPHDEMQVAGGDVLTVLMGHHLQGLLARAVLALVREVGGLHLTGAAAAASGAAKVSGCRCSN
jgi:hypothetical protein